MSPDLLAGYPAARARFDEMFDAPGRVRPHFQRILRLLADSPAHLIGERLESVERQIRDHGVTYNVYADPQGLDRPWELDALPQVIPAAEWETLQAGIAQRAELLNRILADLYGPQVLLREGLIPPELVYSHGGFLRPAHGTRPPGGLFLHLYAADLARSPDGRWWVLADRTQAPSGAGYALENRLIVSRVFPDLFRDLRVLHQASFFAGFRDSLARLAPREDGPPLTVLLTPGPYNETYFEHALLARYLGFPLVEGADLVVRDGRVWLKTLEGGRRVHAILRRLDEDYCDPLELRADSALGVPGLADCARRGSVVLANALGSGVLESGALLGFLPAIAERLMGERLKIPSVATWWCGESAARDDAFARLERLVFKPATPAHPFEPVFGQDLDEAAARRFREQVRSHPERYVAQELVNVSQAPVLERGAPMRIGARSLGLRVFAAANARGYSVMPGGLARVAASPSVRAVSMQRGGASKDTWVLSPGPVNASFTLLRSTVGPADLVRAGAALPSRVAENLFWFGRYAERSEDCARLLRLGLNHLLEGADETAAEAAAVRVLAWRCGMLERAGPADQDLLKAASRADQGPGLAANLRQLSRVAHSLRDRLSADNWRTLNRLTQDGVFERQPSLLEALGWVDRAITGLVTLSGYAFDGMTRDTGWRFLSIGRRVERLGFICQALEIALHEGRAAGLGWLLELTDSSITYRSRYLSSPEWLPVLDLIVLDEGNPRALRFLADGVLDFLRKLQKRFGPCGGDEFERAVLALRALDPATDLQPDSAHLVRTLGDLRQAAFEVSNHLGARFFGQSVAIRQTPLSV
ncbi:MAG: circularly permuted type 2 ATP-grasp protein [Burkholderiales bacterium]|nr:circularly permuted type 2 ATP-grasp protein [Burkholderiales bacterium]